MSDPYKVLNIAPTASDDEVKHAYRELARKYHPDNYHDNPLADLAQEKMKEINEAYEQIQKQRKNGGASSSGRDYSAQGSSSSYGAQGSASYGTQNSVPVLYQVRIAINSGDISRAEQLLNASPDRGAEWNFLMGVVCTRRGWMDEAKRHLTAACRMDPANPEYRDALNRLSGTGYRPVGYRTGGTMSYNGDLCMRICAAWSCCMLTGGHCFFC